MARQNISVQEKNKAIVQRFKDEAYNKGIFATVDELVAIDHVWHGPGVIAGVGSSREDLKTWITMLRSAFPDVQLSVDEIIAEGDKVAARGVTRGTHLGPFMGIPPTGNRIEMYGIQVNQIADGKIVGTWAVFDIMSMMKQLTIGGPLVTGQQDASIAQLAADILGSLQQLKVGLVQSVQSNGTNGSVG